MKTTSLHRRYGTQDSNKFDPQLDFAMFLKEAGNYQVNKTKVDHQLSSLENVKQSNGLKTKKSWKYSFLFSWLKAAKKGNKPSLMETIPSEKSYSIPTLRCGHSGPSQKSYSIPTMRRGHSGPIYGNGGTTGSNRLWRQHNSFFKTTEEQTPYICLDKLNGIESYGPVYLVT